MKRLNNSQPLAVATQFRPLSTAMHIEVVGGMSLMQFYRNVSQQWSPDHTIEPQFDKDGGQVDGTLRLRAVYSLIDPDGLLNTDKLRPQIFWFVDGKQITTNDVSADFYVSADMLYVRKNFTHLQGAVIVCECRFTDTRTSSPFVLSDSASLSAILQSDEQWSLSLLCDKTQKHYPLYAKSTIYAFQAEARLGSISKDDSVAWFWDYSTDNGLSWHEIDTSCYWYVSGKNTSALRVDMDFIESLTVRVRISDDKVSTKPALPVSATASCAWRMPFLRPVVFCYGGDRVFAETDYMTFGCHVHVPKHDDLSLVQQREWLMFDWQKREQGKKVSTPIKVYEPECTLAGSELFNLENRKFIIDPNLLFCGPYDIIADANGEPYQIGDDLLAIRS